MAGVKMIGFLESIPEALGRVILTAMGLLLKLFGEVGGITSLILQTLYQAVRPPFRWRLLMDQMKKIGYESLPVVSLTALFSGAVLVLQTGYQLNKFGAKHFVGGIAAIALCREIGPVFTAIVVSGRVGAAMAAELGSMKVTEQIDALRAMAVDPVEYLVVPRLLAALVMLPTLAIFSDAVGIFGGYVVGTRLLEIPHAGYLNNIEYYLDLSDVYTGIAKMVVFGAIVAIIGCYFGLTTTRGAEGVGRSTMVAVVVCIVLIFLSDYFMTTWILFFQGLVS